MNHLRKNTAVGIFIVTIFHAQAKLHLSSPICFLVYFYLNTMWQPTDFYFIHYIVIVPNCLTKFN